MAVRPPAPDGARSGDQDGSEGTGLRPIREQLCQDVLSRALPPAELPARYSAAVDGWLSSRLGEATGHRERGFALLAVGGYGRGELAPGSDLDLVLLHRARRNVSRVAESIWYAIWDAGLRLDHSVRTRTEVIAVARTDLRAVLGLLDARVVAGDPAVARRLLTEMPELWRKQSATMLPELEESLRQRHHAAGELAFLLEPDLKLARGGLRDLAILRALALASPSIEAGLDLEVLDRAERLLIGARVALQVRTASASDRLLLQEQDQVAELLGFADADLLMAAMAEAGRAITSASDLAWRRIRSDRLPSSANLAAELPVAPGIVVRRGEIALVESADPRTEPALLLEVARAAAERNALIERETLDRLEREATAPLTPWSDRTREAFIGLLSTGDALVPAVEALDQRHLFELVLPEWKAVRNRPQRNAYHRYTVDRHLLEAIARVGEHLAAVGRPDLLLLGALLHDIGKGQPGDHSEVGQEIAATVARRMGYDEADVATVVKLVAYHLVLPEVATRRDLDDPATAALVAKLVQSPATLELLAALTEADSQATGPAAWGSWKAELVAKLVDRVGGVLAGEELPPYREPELTAEQLELVTRGDLALRAHGRSLTVVAPDRRGLFAAVTGVLALHGCNVRRASASPGAGGMAVETFEVIPAFDRLPNWERVEVDLQDALAGSLDLESRLAEQDRTYARGRRPASAYPTQAHVLLDNDSSALASIVEVRALDRLGLLHAITAAFARLGLDVVSALVDTLGHEVIDTFYVKSPTGEKLAIDGIGEATRLELEQVINRGE